MAAMLRVVMQVTESASRRFGQIGTVPCMEMHMEIDGVEILICSGYELEEAIQEHSFYTLDGPYEIASSYMVIREMRVPGPNEVG